MKATIIEIESQRLSDFCYYHGGIRVADEWLDAEGKTLRFLTQDKKHSSYEYYSYVYISKEIGRSRPFDFMFGNNESTVATCKDEEGDECFILCKHPKLGQVVEFEKEGFYPYETLSKILCKWKQDSVVSLFLYMNSVFKHKHKLIHNQAPV